VLGDIRSIRGNFRSQEWRVNWPATKATAKSEAAQAAVRAVDGALRSPTSCADWLEVMWQMSSAFMTGYRPHEVVWSLQDGKYLPQQVLDRPGRRIRFDARGDPLLLSKGNLMGAPIEEPYQMVISRHMADTVNPYGVAVMSACFWVWTFKTGGWRYFMKYCERHGLPWPIGRYPMGTTEEDQAALEKALASMIEATYAVVPEGTGIELLVPSGKGSGELPQQSLIELSNREMSKALTGQAMVAELQGAGARAASETAFKRQEAIDDSVRDIAVQSMGVIFRWITLFNFGDGVAPPQLGFFKRDKAGKDRAETYKLVVSLGARPSKAAMLEELGIPEAMTDDDALLPAVAPARPATKPGTTPGTTDADTNPDVDADDAREMLSGIAGFEFARAAGMTEDDAIELVASAADTAIEDRMIAPVYEMLVRYEREGRTLDEFAADLAGLVGTMDDEALREVTDRALRYAVLRGAATQVA
jgi:phage gp29-like protein